MTKVIYRVDSDDRIIFINSAWLQFAAANGMSPDVSKSMVGTRLWKHISDLTVRHFYKVLMGKVRKTGKCVAVPFRCDSPHLLRFMEMKITKLDNDALEFKNVLVREECRKRPASLLTDELEHKMLLMCLGCDRVKLTRWLEPEHAAQKLKLFEKSVLPLVSHSVCPQCNSIGFRTVID
ncbi:MAG TPA: hypothetical protein VG347_06040 [Verrucomicrobiae bacterium]|nr:hypothetical protein [Verrucomicrobiae bacterium]